MAVTNVLALPGTTLKSAEPNAALVEGFERLLEMAKYGQLQSFIGTGFMADGLRLSHWFDYHDDVYQMLGSIAWLQAEYVRRKTLDD